MEDNNFKYYQEKISKFNKTFKSNDKKANLFSKAVKESIEVFGSSQNEFNDNVSKAFEESNALLENFNNKINVLETKMASILQQNESLKSRINALQRTDLMIVDSCIKSNSENTKLINDYIRKINPEIRNDSAPTGCKEINFQTLTEAIKIPQDSTELDLNTIGKSYKDTLKKELQKIAIDGTNRIISVVCTGFLNPLGVDSATYQAVQIYKLLKKSSVYRVKFISIENSLEHPILDGNFLCIPAKGCGQYLRVINSKLNIFCSNTLDIFSLDDYSLVSQKGLVIITGQNPISDASTDLVEQLSYANDFGIHTYMVQSNNASDILMEKGFHKPSILYPIINKYRLPSVNKKSLSRDDFTIGVVSTITANDNSGVSLLANIIKEKSNYKFRVLWNSSTEVPDGLSKAENCTIVKESKLEDFYSTIDCLLVPYVDTNNESCPESALEVMLLDIPVVCTEICGIAELIKISNLGEIAPPNNIDICNALDRVLYNYNNYRSNIGYSKLENSLDYSNLVDTIERFTEVNYPNGYISLNVWKDSLKKTNKNLIKGEKAILDYYDKLSKVEPPTDSVGRVLSYLELQNLGIILEDRYENSKNLNILDISCKNDRITSQCKNYGKCTPNDSFLASTVDGSYNVITCFDYLQHLEYSSRKIIYNKIFKSLNNSGIFVLNVPNIYFDLVFKNSKGWQNYDIYSMAWSKDSIIEELKENGLKVQYIIPVGQGLNVDAPDSIKNIPISWTIGAIKI